MSKTMSYRLFGAGKIPAQQAAALQSEGVLVVDEGIPGSVTYLNFRSPGRICKWKRQWYSAAIALTRTRLVAFRGAHHSVDVPLQDSHFKGLRFSIENEETLLIAFNASLFHANWSGTIEYRFKTPRAKDFFDQLSG